MRNLTLENCGQILLVGPSLITRLNGQLFPRPADPGHLMALAKCSIVACKELMKDLLESPTLAAEDFYRSQTADVR